MKKIFIPIIVTLSLVFFTLSCKSDDGISYELSKVDQAVLSTQMNNFINVRVQAHNHTKTYNSIKHNLRVIKSLSQKKLSTNDNYIMLDNKVIKITKENKKDLYKQLSTLYQNERY